MNKMSAQQTKNNERVFKMAFASVYPHYVQKAEKKGRTKKELDEVICWLTGIGQRQADGEDPAERMMRVSSATSAGKESQGARDGSRCVRLRQHGA
jgi:hypothetical protein